MRIKQVSGFKQSRWLYLLGLLFGPVLLAGIGGCDTCGPFEDRYRIKKYQTNLIQADQTIQTIQLGPAKPILERDTLTYGQFVIVAFADSEEFFGARSGGSSTTAWACDPAPTEPSDSLAGITITSTGDYDALHPAGSELNDLILTNTINSPFPTTTQLLPDLLTAKDKPAYNFLYFKFRTPPARLQLHQFTTTIRLTNASVFITRTTPVYIKP